MCQTCVDEGVLSQEMYDSMGDFLSLYPRAEFGPAHIVLGDCNVEEHHVQFCIRLCEAALLNSAKGLSKSDVALMKKVNWYSDYSKDELDATRLFLKTLLVSPE